MTDKEVYKYIYARPNKQVRTVTRRALETQISGVRESRGDRGVTGIFLLRIGYVNCGKRGSSRTLHLRSWYA